MITLGWLLLSLTVVNALLASMMAVTDKDPIKRLGYLLQLVYAVPACFFFWWALHL